MYSNNIVNFQESTTISNACTKKAGNLLNAPRNVICLHLVLNAKQFNLTHRQDPIRYYYSESERTWERWQWRGSPHSPKFQHYCSLTLRLFRVVSRTLVARGLTPLQRCSYWILQHQPTGLRICVCVCRPPTYVCIEIMWMRERKYLYICSHT